MAKYGEMYKVADFVTRTIGRTAKTSSPQLALRTLDFLKHLDRAQNNNPLFTTSIHVGGGISFLWSGELLFSMWPAKGYLRLFWHRTKDTTTPLAKLLDAAKAKDKVYEYIPASRQHQRRGWLIPESGLSIVEKYVTKLPRPSSSEMKRQGREHPRFISGEVRQIALDRFIDGGRKCPGVKPMKAHKVNLDAGERIEFDHILPHAMGGSGTDINVQVLCQACNNRKRATALGNAVQPSKLRTMSR